MKNEQVLDELHGLLEYMNNQLDEIKSLYEKFLVALTGILRLTNSDAPLLTSLRGDPENLNSYLIQMTMKMSDITTQSYESIQQSIETIIGLISTDRKF